MKGARELVTPANTEFFLETQLASPNCADNEVAFNQDANNQTNTGSNRFSPLDVDSSDDSVGYPDESDDVMTKNFEKKKRDF